MKNRPDNYAVLADRARQLFLTYDQNRLIANAPVTADQAYIYLRVLDRTCRISRSRGYIQWPDGECWQDSTLPGDYLTIFDYLCDSKPDRTLSGRWLSMANFGNLFHTGLLENSVPSPLELRIDREPEAFRRACRALGGVPFDRCDIGFRLPLFPDLPVAVQFWHSDDEFGPRLRWLWDENALSFIRYETMYYALGILRGRLSARMQGF